VWNYSPLSFVVYKVDMPGHDTILCRVNGIGTEKLLERDRETKQMNMLAKVELGPKVFFTFNNGFIYAFIPDRCIKPEEMEIFAPKIAKQLAIFHKIQLDNGKHGSNIIRMVKKWFKESMCTYCDIFFYYQYDIIYNTYIYIVKIFKFENEEIKKFEALKLTEMEQELQELEKLAIKYNCDIVFCHNDLLPYNILYEEKSGDIHFIDFEYCGYNYRGFDIGNHFCEYSSIIDPALYPSVEKQKNFIRHYAENLNLETITEELLEQIRVEANFFALLANLAWGTWAVPQGIYIHIQTQIYTSMHI
jgi:ethanolamine kinase